jgi:hypothetical protein
MEFFLLFLLFLLFYFFIFYIKKIFLHYMSIGVFQTYTHANHPLEGDAKSACRNGSL